MNTEPELGDIKFFKKKKKKKEFSHLLSPHIDTQKINQKLSGSQSQWSTPVIPALRRQRQEELKFTAT
jgi:hypothetical protein